MPLSKEVLRKQHEYNKQSSSFNLIISIFFGLLFSLKNLTSDPKFSNIFVGTLLFIILWNSLKTNYIGDVYESRIVNDNTRNPYEKVLLKIKHEDSNPEKKWYKIWRISYFGFGFKNYWSSLLSHIILICMGMYLIIC